MSKIPHSLMELHKITAYRDGCIWSTEYVKDVWVPFDNRKPPADHVYVSLSTDRIRDFIARKEMTNRMIEV